jgi:hypothetical protein
VHGVVVVVGVWAAQAAAGAAPGAGPAGAGVWWRLVPLALVALPGPPPGIVVGLVVLLLALALALVGLLLAALSSAVGAGATGAGAEAAFAAGVIGLAEGGAAVLAVTPDPGRVCDHLIVTSRAKRRPPGAGVRVASKRG